MPTGQGHIFTTRLAIMGLHFQQSYYDGFAHFQDFGGEKILVIGDYEITRFMV